RNSGEERAVLTVAALRYGTTTGRSASAAAAPIQVTKPAVSNDTRSSPRKSTDGHAGSADAAAGATAASRSPTSLSPGLIDERLGLSRRMSDSVLRFLLLWAHERRHRERARTTGPGADAGPDRRSPQTGRLGVDGAGHRPGGPA